MTGHVALKRLGGAALGVIALAGITAGDVAAQPAEEFFKGRTISILVGAGVGGSYVPYAHLVADHLPRHMSGAPTIIVKTMGGQGGGIDTAIQMHNTQPKDGTVMALTQQTIVLAQVINPQFARYDARQWNWLGNLSVVRNMLAIWHTAKAKSIEDVRVHETIAGTTGPASPTHIMPSFLNRFAGTKFRLVSGYKGSADLNIAIQRGEIEVRGGSWLSVELQSPDLIEGGKLKPIVFASLERDPGFPNIPTLADLVTDPKAKQAAEFISAEASFGRAFFLPPGVPADRVALMRRAWDAMVKDPAFLADAKKKNLPIEVTDWRALERATAQVIGTPKEIAELAK